MENLNLNQVQYYPLFLFNLYLWGVTAEGNYTSNISINKKKTYSNAFITCKDFQYPFENPVSCLWVPIVVPVCIVVPICMYSCACMYSVVGVQLCLQLWEKPISCLWVIHLYLSEIFYNENIKNKQSNRIEQGHQLNSLIPKNESYVNFIYTLVHASGLGINPMKFIWS